MLRDQGVYREHKRSGEVASVAVENGRAIRKCAKV